jgi:hypothetical protein
LSGSAGVWGAPASVTCGNGCELACAVRGDAGALGAHMLAASPSRALAAVMVRAKEVFPQLRAPFLVRRRLPSEVAGVISLLPYAVVGIEGVMGVHMLVAGLTRSLVVSQFGVEGEPRWLTSPMVLQRPASSPRRRV